MEKRFKGKLKSDSTSKVSVSEVINKRPDELDNQVRAALGRMWNCWPPRIEAKKACREWVKVGKYKNGNDKYIYMFRCAHCNELFDRVDVDHIDPVVCPVQGFVDIDTWVRRKFVPADCLQVLCLVDHKKKTKLEADVRMKMRRQKEYESNEARGR